jgi:hypothetical protein
MEILKEDVIERNIITDILFRIDNHIFSYRVAGILVYDDKVLL